MSDADYSIVANMSVTGFGEANAAIDAIDTTIKKLARGADMAGKPIAGLGENLKKMAQMSSSITGVIGGLAALGGVKMAADAIANLSKKALELKGAYDKGEISSKEFYDQMARAVPIAGSLYSAVHDGTQAIRDYMASAARAVGTSDQFADSLQSIATKAEQAKANLDALKQLQALSQGLKDARIDMGGDDWDKRFGEAAARKDAAIAQADEAFTRGMNPGAEQRKAAERLKAALESGVDENLARDQFRREMDATIKVKPEEQLRRERDRAVGLAKDNYKAEQDRIIGEREMAQRAQLNTWGYKIDPSRTIADQFVDEDRRRSDITNAERDRGATPGVTIEIQKRIEEMAKAVEGYSKAAFDAERQKFAENGASRDDLFKFDGGGDEWRRRSLSAKRDARGVSQGLGAGVESTLDALGGVGGAFGEVSKRSKKLTEDFDRAVREAEESIAFKNLTPNQIEIEQFRRRGVSEEQLTKLAALQEKQEKQSASTQMLSASGVQDYIQQAIGNAPMQQKTLQAAEKTATASEKLAASVKDGSIQVIVKSMPAQVATYG